MGKGCDKMFGVPCCISFRGLTREFYSLKIIKKNGKQQCAIKLMLILLSARFSQQGKGQRRSAAVHIVDAVILGGKDVRNLHYSER